ncbi:hypothetical protein QF026_000122 [Streptomyces aurantiacus]|nr:hypothetical protein [Streptomyces aurantiacus]
MNIQVLADPFARLLWASPALPGSTHDLTAARHHGIIDARPRSAGRARRIKAPTCLFESRSAGRRLKRWKRRHNTSHPEIRCVGERAMATLKGRRLLRKLPYSTNRITDMVKAVLVLHHAPT